ncbi:MAG: TetR/AcrR family transcriptional regulator [Bryobacteraceae bacterium]|jgi:AcrR family transcriptional regulator
MQRERPYHHGNLKQTLVRAAVKILAKRGPRDFTLREVARQAKVSHNAPYRHFRDKDELLAAVAGDGFEKLADSMIAASANAGNALQALEWSGLGYVRFALEWPEHFSAMFDYSQDLSAYPEYAASGRRAFQVLLDNIVAAQKARKMPPGDPQALALVAWSLVHGIAKLAIAKRLPLGSAEATLRFTEFATGALVGGLSNIVRG